MLKTSRKIHNTDTKCRCYFFKLNQGEKIMEDNIINVITVVVNAVFVVINFFKGRKNNGK